jgi:hypothetical protein
MLRRRFLTLAALGAIAVTRPTTGGAAAPMPVGRVLPGELLAMLGSEGAVRQLGERYRQLVPAENDEQVLVRAILKSTPPNVTSDLATALAAQVRDDFTQGRTVTVNGWILSVTEARQCALCSIDA